MISRKSSIVILTGAGISAESGLKTFRDNNGLWETHKVEDVATPEAFQADPETVQRFYNLRRKQLLSEDVKPNAAHIALGRLEKEWDAKVLIITQNIDNLHERGGTKNIIHMHGELLKSRCSKTNQTFTCHSDITSESHCDCCGKKGSLRPHVVWFGEMPIGLESISKALSGCELFISIGTSGQVYPAAGFVAEVTSQGRGHTVELNKEVSGGSHLFHEKFYGPATEVVPNYVNNLLEIS